MTIRSQIGKVREEVLCSLFRRAVMLENPAPTVSFTFDDFPRSALTVGAGIIERFGGRATYYTAMGLMGTSNKLGEHFIATDLSALIERGHELANHTFSHRSARRTSCDEFIEDVTRCEKAIRATIGANSSNNFAYPYGETTLAMKKQLGPRLGSSRGTCGGLNGPQVDLNLLRANRLYGGVEQFEPAKRLILENEKRNSWLIFYTHDVSEDPSPFGCTPALLERTASFAAERGHRSVPIASVVTELSLA